MLIARIGLVGIYLLQYGVNVARYGQDRGKYDAISETAGLLVVLALLVVGGFFADRKAAQG